MAAQSRQQSDYISWIMIGEVTFDSAAAPEPASLALVGLGLAGMGLARRRKVVA